MPGPAEEEERYGYAAWAQKQLEAGHAELVQLKRFGSYMSAEASADAGAKLT